MASEKRAPLFGIGIFFGVLLGYILAVALSTSDTSETYEDYKARMAKESGGQRPGGGQRAGDPHGRGGDPHARGGNQKPAGDPHGGGAGHGGQQDRAQQSAAKAHFMKKFVAALSDTPQNMQPNPEYKPLLKEGASLSCAGCHDPGQFNIEGMKQMDPGTEKVDPFRKSPRFMWPLMDKWVKRLNKLHGDKLVEPVTCTSCHAIDPRNMEERIRVYPALMVSFVKALREKPTNKNPAASWKPLLKPEAGESMLCASCHGEKTGKALEGNLDRYDLSRPAKYADNKSFMVHIMDRWMKRANRELSKVLVEPLTCLSCHDTDPRR
ncbi:MAG: hypothetical protein ACYTGN_01070 [Planctomycetota bacterium]|jgi:hypothetical protein